MFCYEKCSLYNPDLTMSCLTEHPLITIGPLLQADTNTVRASILGITVVGRVVIAPKTLGALLANESTTRGRLNGSADARRVAGHAAGAGNARIVDAVRALLAWGRRLHTEATACLVLVLEVTSAGATVEVGAAIVVGYALCVCRAGSNLEAAAPAVGALLGGGKAEESGSDEVGEEHCD